MPDVDLVTYIDGRVGRVVLNRPEALNALTLPMMRHLDKTLSEWQSHPLRAVTIESSSDRAFCAGGDMRIIRQNTLEEDFAASEEFFDVEYSVNLKLANYHVPVIALIDGICLGGGLGLSVHGMFCVVTDRAVMSMPEAAIGFFPDVGGTHFLSRLPGAVGTYLGLTGARLGAADAVDIGLASHRVTREALYALPSAIDATDSSIEGVLRSFKPAPAEGLPLRDIRPKIDEIFSAPDLATIMSRLEHDASPWSTKTLRDLEALSPQSLRLSFDLMTWGAERTLQECLGAELSAARHVAISHDLLEGVRAVLVDKDRRPVWGSDQYGGITADGALVWGERTLDSTPTAP